MELADAYVVREAGEEGFGAVGEFGAGGAGEGDFGVALVAGDVDVVGGCLGIGFWG